VTFVMGNLSYSPPPPPPSHPLPASALAQSEAPSPLITGIQLDVPSSVHDVRPRQDGLSLRRLTTAAMAMITRAPAITTSSVSIRTSDPRIRSQDCARVTTRTRSAYTITSGDRICPQAAPARQARTGVTGSAGARFSVGRFNLTVLRLAVRQLMNAETA
jgi:hypothetical protein